MSKPTLVYTVMLAACAGGMWGILRAGGSMPAVSDLAGEWKITSGPMGPDIGGMERLGDTMTIDQSGRFFHLRFQSGLVLDLKTDTPPMGPVQKPIALDIADGTSRLVATVQPENHTLVGTFSLKGPNAVEFHAWRTTRNDSRR